MKRLYTASLLLFITLTTGYGQKLQPPNTASKPDIIQQDVGYHLRWLASDDLQGRGSGTKGNAVAAEYIAREFQRFGLVPAGEKGTYMQEFTVVTNVELAKNNALATTLNGKKSKWTLRREFIPIGFSESGSVRGEVVFAGYGISSSQLQHDDYKNLDVKGKIALVLAGNPAADDPHSDFGPVSSLRSKALFAREAGAKAMLVIDPEKDDLIKLRYDNSPSSAGILVANISKSVADAFLKSAGTDLKTTLEKLKKDRTSPGFVLSGFTCDLSLAINLVRKPTFNVIGKLEGTDPVAKARAIVIGAHFDHLGWGSDNSLYKGKKPMIHNGADDNASGTSGMLELAQYFSTHRPRHSMLFMGFSGEEMGLLGSGHWVHHPSVPLEQITAMFNLDMVGRLADSTMKLNVQGTGTSPVWERIVKGANEPYAFDLALIPDGQGASDHSSFYLKGIPVLFFFTGLHTDYHRPSDDFDKINLPGTEKVVRYIADIITRTDAESEKLAFTKVAVSEDRRVRGFSVYVGTIPDYGYQGEGFRISGTSPGGPAEKAGMKEGDVIIKFGETGIKNIYDYMNALSLHKPDEEVPVIVKRGDETVTLQVHLVKK